MLRSSKPVPQGKLVTCPKCQVMFAAPPPEEESVEVVEVVEEAVEVVEDGVEVVEDDAPPRRKKARANAAVEVVEVVEDDEDEDERPKRKPKRKKSGGGSSVLIPILVAAGVLLLAGGGCLVYWLVTRGGGGGDVDLLTYVPPNSQLVMGADLKALWGTPLAPHVEKLFDTGEAFSIFRKYKQDKGASYRDLAERVVIGVQPEGGKQVGTLLIASGVALDSSKLMSAGTSVTVGSQSATRVPAVGGTTQILALPTRRLFLQSELSEGQLGDVVRGGGRVGGSVGELLAKARGGHFFLASSREGMSASNALSAIGGGASAMPEGVIGQATWYTAVGNEVEYHEVFAVRDAALAQQIADAVEKVKQNPGLLAVAMAIMPPAVKDFNSQIRANAQTKVDGTYVVTQSRISMSATDAFLGALMQLMATATPAPTQPPANQQQPQEKGKRGGGGGRGKRG
ncbi:MAG: hypothetical protein U0746_04750 [Gemmataceae bacterium]